MHIKINVSHYEDVVLSDPEVKDIVRRHLKKKFSIPNDPSIKDGKLMTTYEVRTSHAWDETDPVRKATDLDKAVLKVLDNL